MTTPKDDQPLSPNPEPNMTAEVLVQAETQTLGTMAAPQPEKKSEEEPRKEFDPWKFGVHTMPPGLREEILAKGLPDTPGGGFWEKVGKASPAEPASTAPKPNGKTERDTDTLRLQRVKRAERAPVDHPLRAVVPWLVIAAVGTIILLWMLIGKDAPEPRGDDAATQQAVPADTDATAPLMTSKPTSATPPVSAPPSEPDVQSSTGSTPSAVPSAAKAPGKRAGDRSRPLPVTAPVPAPGTGAVPVAKPAPNGGFDPSKPWED